MNDQIRKMSKSIEKRLAGIEGDVLDAVARWEQLAKSEDVPVRTIARWARLQQTIRTAFEI
jgi:hypothetical protein